MIYRFADCALDTQLHSLHRAGQSIRLTPKVFEVLCYLIEHRDRVVSKQELCEQVWKGLAITDATLESCLHTVRGAVGDSGQAQRIIQTQRGYGYRFVTDVTSEPSRSEVEPGAMRIPLEPQPAPTLTPSPALPVVSTPSGPQPSAHQLCGTCQYVNSAQALFCAACGSRLRQLCAHCGQSVTLPAIFCTACGQSLNALAPPDPLPDTSEQAERKSVTILCCAVAAPTSASGRVDLDALHSLLLTVHALAQEVVQQYGGQLYPVVGERLMAMFGVPVAHEDDARRAVRVALELRRRVSAQRLGGTSGAALPLRLGLHTGLVMVGGIRNGGETGTAVTVVGDVVSVATLLQERAKPGTIVCSDATARLLQGLVRLEPRGPLQDPSQPGALETYTILARHGRRSPVEPPRGRVLSPFVGREREMTTLHALLTQVEEGRGQVVGVVGEPGLGKSRLLYEFRRSLGEREHRLAYRAGRCQSYGSTTPYLPVLELLRYHCGITPTDTPENVTAKIHRGLQGVGMDSETWAPVLLYLLGLQADVSGLAELSPEARKARILTALTQMCLQGSRRQPFILEIEDLHWIDASSDECLTALVERMAGAPLMVLVTYRPGYRPAWMDHSYVTQLALQPLIRKDSLQVVQAVLPTAAFTTPFVPPLLRKAEGNPFFLEELAHAVAEQGTETPASAVPDTVQAVLLSRIDRLSPTAKRLLQAAAVIGKDVALPLLHLVTEVPEQSMERELGSLQAAEFLYETQASPLPMYTFKHALTQEVTYQSLGRQARQQYHARVAQGLEAKFPDVVESQPELLAQHYTVAGLARQAIPYWLRAGQRANERSAHNEAVSHCLKGLEVLQALPESLERMQHELALHLALGAPLWTLKGHAAPEVEQVYNRTLILCQDVGETPQRFSVLVGLWRFYLARAKLHKARELAEQCASLAAYLQEPAFLLEAHLMLGSTLFYLGDLWAGHKHLEQGIALYHLGQGHARALSRATDPGVDCLCRSAWALCFLGYPEQAIARSHEALALAEQLSHAHSKTFASFYASVLHQFRRDAQAVLEQATATMALAQEGGFGQWLLGGTISRDWAQVTPRPTGDNITQLSQSLAAWHATGVELGNSRLYAMLVEVYAKAGQTEAGLERLRDAFALVHRNEEHYYDAELYRLQGELLLLQTVPNIREAENSFQLALNIARSQHAKLLELRASICLSRLWQYQGKREQARLLLAETYAWFTEGFNTPDLQEAQVLLSTLE